MDEGFLCSEEHLKRVERRAMDDLDPTLRTQNGPAEGTPLSEEDIGFTQPGFTQTQVCAAAG